MKNIVQRTCRWALLAVIGLGLVMTANVEALAAKKKILVITQSKGFTHGVVRRKDGELCVVEKVLARIGQDTGLFETVNSQNAIKVLTKDNLKNFDAVFFYTTGTLIPKGTPREALLDFVRQGKAFIGTHSATDTFADFPGYFNFINGTFAGHPWNAGNTSTFVNHEVDHPAVNMFPESFRYKDEIYQYRNYTPESVRVLISLDMAGSNPKRPYHVPVCWVREFGKGRLFYTNFGHNESTWKDPRFQSHLLEGIKWAWGMKEGPISPNPDVQAMEHFKSFVAASNVTQGGDKDALLGKAKAKGRKNAKFMAQLRQSVDAYNELSKKSGNKKLSANERNALKEQTHLAARKIVALVNE